MATIISMWSGPRNISTTMMRAFANRGDTAAIDEPFYACYLKASGAEHPYRKETLAAYPSDRRAVLRWIDAPPPGGEPIVFLKHIAYHLAEDDDLGFLRSHRNFLLIRDPRAMVASFAEKFDDVRPIVRSYTMAMKIFDYLAAHGISCPVIDAADVLRSPELMLAALCDALGISFDGNMLAWAAGPRPEDGPWAPHWYDAVRSSTGFAPYVEKNPLLSPALETAAAEANDAYISLYGRRLRR